MSEQIKVYEFGRFHLDVVEGLLLLDGQPVSIEPQVFKTLLALIENNGHLCEKRWLIEQVWGNTIVEEGNLTRNISVLRKLLGNGYIQTIPKRGYRFVVPMDEQRDEEVEVLVQQRVSSSIVLEEEIETDATDQPDEAAVAIWPEVRDQTTGVRSSRQSSAGMAQTEASHQPRRSRWGLKAALVLGGLLALASLGTLLWSGAGKEEAGTSLRNASFTQLTDQPFLEYYPSLSPDGKSFAYLSFVTGNGDIYLQRVGGRNSINLTPDSTALDLHPAFSPSGEQIAFRSERDGGGIFVMGATGENVRRLTDFGFHPAWSPDGKYILCATGIVWTPESCRTISQVWLVNVTTGEKRKLVTNEDANQPQWSPNGHRIAYWGRQGGQRNLWTMPASGGESVQVTNDTATNWNPIWSPDGKYLYYASNRRGSMSLWRVALDETSGKVLSQPEPVTTPSEYAMHLSFSRDGRQLAYVSEIRRANLHRIEFDPVRGTVRREPLAITQGSQQMLKPELSLDGGWLAVWSTGNEQEDISIIRPDGTGMRQLTNDIHKDRQHRWSPDGKRIAFSSARTGSFEIWTINRDGSSLQQLTFTAGRNATQPVWSPDGTRLAYSLGGSDTFIIETGRPWSQQTPQLVPQVSGTQAGFRAFSWSADGRKLAGWYRRSESETENAFSIALYSIESQQFEKFDAFGITPVWLSDGRRLIFGDGGGVLYLLDTQTKQVRQLYSLAPQLIEGFTLSQDDRLIYFSYFTEEADIWQLSLP